MKLKEILKGVNFKVISGELSVEINKFEHDSRKIGNNDLFFAQVGYTFDGHNYIDDVIAKGAVAIIVTKDIDPIEGVTIIKVQEENKAFAICSSNYFGNPKDKLKIIGVTGTNGKTTSTFILKSILEECGCKVGVIGTIANYIGDKKLKSRNTTPIAYELHKLFNEMIKGGVEYCIMEVSSHALALNRVYGVEFDYGIYTNLTQDHLDFHKDFEDYFNAKLKLFKQSNKIIVNIDDDYSERILKNCKSEGVTYSIDKESDLRAEDIQLLPRGVQFNLNNDNKKENMYVDIPGRHNVYNSLGCIGVCISEKLDVEKIKEGLCKVFVPGRCEIVTKKYDLGFDVIVDYAHTPDALENILKTAREFTEGKLISVFGCGGDRDSAKRPIMGRVGCELSDVAVITSDNPRTEEPIAIIEDILKGIDNKENYIAVENRREAIKKAMTIAGKGDVIVIAGKGHEDYQVLKEGTIHFDEREVVEELIKELF